MLPLGPVTVHVKMLVLTVIFLYLSRKLLIKVTVIPVCETNADVFLERFALFNQKKNN